MIAPGSLLTVFAVALAAFTACLAAEDYPMGEIPLEDPRWKNALGRLNASLAEKAAAAESEDRKTVEILQHIEGSSYLAHMRTPQKAAGSAASALGRITGSSRSVVPAGDWETIRLDLPKGANRLADGEKFLKGIEETGKTFQYTTTLGARATVKVYRIAGTGEKYAPLTMEQFVALLRAGETWTLPLKTGERGCPNCYGRGRTGGGLNGPPARTCEECDGKKKIPIIKNFRIRW